MFEQMRIMQRCLLTLAEALAARVIEQVIDHVLGQPFRLCDGRAYRRAIAALMRDRNLDATHLLELVWQDALIEQLVPIFDPGNAALPARHQSDHARIGRTGALGRFYELARAPCAFAFFSVSPTRPLFS